MTLAVLRAAILLAFAASAVSPAVAAQKPPPPPPGADPALWERALELHYASVVVDTHSDTTTRMLDEGFDMGRRAPDGHMDLPRIASGGLDAQFYAIYVARHWAGDEPATPDMSARRALRMIDALYRQVDRHAGRMEMAFSVEDVLRIAGQGRHAALMGIEGGHAIEGDLALLRCFHRLGVRYMTLTHTNTNQFADSSGDEARWNGLNELGERVVLEMNRLGMMVDLSHVSDETFYDALRVTRAPVILSHSSVRALCPAPRNVTDDMLEALAENGGVCMINFGDLFLTPESYKAWQMRRTQVGIRLREIRRRHPPGSPERLEAEAELERRFPRPDPPAFEDLMAHFVHALETAGPDHVGLGSDFDGVPGLPAGLEDCSRLPWITYDLLRRGYSEEVVGKVLGGNLLRVFRQVEETAGRLAAEEPRLCPEPEPPGGRR